jgi:hypothetical protein
MLPVSLKFRVFRVFLVLPVSLVFPVFPDFLVPSVRVPDTPREYIASAPRAVAVTLVALCPS